MAEPAPTVEERVLRLQEDGKPFSAVLEVARAVDHLTGRVDELERQAPPPPAGTAEQVRVVPPSQGGS